SIISWSTFTELTSQMGCNAPGRTFYPEAYRDQPGIEFIEKVPTSWDVTKVVLGEVGSYITIARKHDGEWYVGSMTNWEARTLQTPLPSLGPGQFVAEVYSDSDIAREVPSRMILQSFPVTATDVVIANLAAGEGQAIRIYPAVAPPRIK